MKVVLGSCIVMALLTGCGVSTNATDATSEEETATPILVADAEITRAPRADSPVPAEFIDRRPLGKRLQGITDLPAALDKARTERKYFLIQYGREACSNCQKVWDMLGTGEIKLPSNMFYVDLSCDDSETQGAFLSRYAPEDDGYYYPFIIIADPDGNQVFGCSGLYSAEMYNQFIQEALGTTTPTAAE